MAKMNIRTKIQTLLFHGGRISPFSSSPRLRKIPPPLQNPNFSSASSICYRQCFPSKPSSSFPSSSSSSISLRYLNTTCTKHVKFQNPDREADRTETDEEVEPIEVWEDEDDAEPEYGDGGDGGGVVLNNLPWGERALSIAQEVMLQYGDDMELFSFKTTPGGYVYVRLDRLSNKYGCPGVDDLGSFNRQYKKILDELGEDGELPSDLGVEVSSPGAERLLRIPVDLERFKDMPMVVTYVESDDSRSPEKNGVFFLDSIETESGSCIWRLADVKENREPTAKGRSLSRKRRDWRLKLTYAMVRKVSLYLDY